MDWQGPGSDLGISGPIPIVVFSSPTFSTQTHLKLSELTRSPQHLLLVADTYTEASVQPTQMQNCTLTGYLLGLLSQKLPVPAISFSAGHARGPPIWLPSSFVPCAPTSCQLPPILLIPLLCHCRYSHYSPYQCHSRYGLWTSARPQILCTSPWWDKFRNEE